mgnify:CR=1 FL=1
MNKKQYNSVIDYTLKSEKALESDDSLSTARAIFKNLGVALPQGDIKRVFDTIKTNSYMGWRSCTMEEAQEAANKGTAAIGISENKIVVISANDEEQPVTKTASVMPLDENTSAFEVSGLLYYSYGYGSTGCGGDTCQQNTWNEIVFSNLDTLHGLARQYDSGNQIKLTLQFIRRSVYNGNNWDIVAGEINQGFVNYVRNNNYYIYNFFTTNSLMIYDCSGSQIDFLHLCATMNGIIVGGGTYWKSLIVGQTHVRNLAGWAGDLQTLVVDAYVLTNASNNYNTFYNKENPCCNNHKIPVVLIMTSNCDEEMYDSIGYTALLKQYKGTLETFVGPTQILCCGNTLQVNDYSKYDWTMFNPDVKKKHHDNTFKDYLDKAYEIGKSVIISSGPSI